MSEERIVKMILDLKDTMMERFDEHEKELKKISERQIGFQEETRLNFAKLEHYMYERTEILFDAHQVCMDAIGDLKSEIKSINNILDNHNHRIYQLELKSKVI